MTNPTPNRPLWEVMQVAFQDGFEKSRDVGDPDGHGYAAELRAIAQEIQRRVELWHSDDVVRWLHSEADHAEAGE
jgi:hypothetical protein